MQRDKHGQSLSGVLVLFEVQKGISPNKAREARLVALGSLMKLFEFG
jgi:hypothetical protein